MRRADLPRASLFLAGSFLAVGAGLAPTARAQEHAEHAHQDARHEPAAASAHGAHAMGHGPEADVQAVLDVVNRLFDGMRTNDGAMVRSAFAEGALLIGTEDQAGEPALRYTSVEDFARAVDGATSEWDEPIWDTMVHVQDHLAAVWTKYAFYLDGEFHHCGVDAFLLARTADGWKITSLSDTRQTEGCEMPPDR